MTTMLASGRDQQMKYQPKRAGIYYHRHPYGQSVRIDDHVYVPIPKCASTWCKQLWEVGSDCNFLKEAGHDLAYVVILRDPVERWISGFAQAQVGNDPSWEGHWERLGWDWVFDTVVFDNHTEPQVSFLAGLDLDRITWFRLDDRLESNMLTWMREQMAIDRDHIQADRRYAGRDQPAKTFRNGVVGRSQQEIIAMAQQAVETRPGAGDRLREFYSEDYALWYGVKFYGE